MATVRVIPPAEPEPQVEIQLNILEARVLRAVLGCTVGDVEGGHVYRLFDQLDDALDNAGVASSGLTGDYELRFGENARVE